MGSKSLDYHCPRCHATIGFDRDSCPACQSVLPATVPPWPTSQAHEGGLGSPPNASALSSAAKSKSPVYIPTHPTPDALNNNHQLNLTTQPPPTLTGSNRIQRVRERLYIFKHHSGPPAVDTVRTTRACLSCYNSVKCRPGPNPDCCRPCKGKNRYCRGPIHAPVLIDIQSWFKTAFASLQSQCGSLETIVKERSMYNLSIGVNRTGAIESYDVDLQSVDDHAATPYDPSSLVRVLDVVFPADQKACLNTASLVSQLNSDDNVESVVRRFVACSMLLCAPDLSRIDRSQCGHAAAPYVILEFIRQIGHEACNLFRCIFHEADEFANLKPRNKVTFVRDKRSFAFNLGLVHSSVQSLVSAKSNWTGSPFMPEDLYGVMPVVLEKLEWLAIGFNKTTFIDGRRCLHSELTELHIGFSSLEGRTSISDSSSNQAPSPRDNVVPNVPRMNSLIAQDSAAQSPGQLSDSSLFQGSGENMVEDCPESPWLAGELERFYQNDLYDVLRSPVQERSLQKDVIRQAKIELEHHDSAITKHLVKKAALEEKSKPWELDSAVSSNIVDSDEVAVDPFQSEPAIEKRIRELEEASKRQDLAIQKHNSKKAALERGIKLNLDYEPGQPSKKPVAQEAEEDTYECFPLAPLSRVEPVARLTRLSSIPAEAFSDHVWDGTESLSSYHECSCETKPPGNQAAVGGTVQEPKPQIPFEQAVEQKDKQPDAEGDKQGAVITRPPKGYAYAPARLHPPTRPHPFARHQRMRPLPSAFESVMDEMSEDLYRVDINEQLAREFRDEKAVPVHDSVKK